MRKWTLVALVFTVFLLLPACTDPVAEPGGGYRAQAEALADAQLGLLTDYITPHERARVVEQLEKLVPLRQARMAENRHEKTPAEARLVEVLNRLYERYTDQYLGQGGTWGYTYPVERELGRYHIIDGETIQKDPAFTPRPGGGYTKEELEGLWPQMLQMLPEGAFADFERFTVFTDGVDETLAYVAPTDEDGQHWEIAVDPADADDGDWFTETVLHEYTHYLTLNDEQADYPGERTAAIYSEDGLCAREGSYLDDFYQAFWTQVLDDRLADRGSYNFFLRHEDDFVTPYASTDPSEDIAESFTYFLLWGPQEGDAVWEQKLNFFSAYPELVSFRQQVCQRLGLGP